MKQDPSADRSGRMEDGPRWLIHRLPTALRSLAYGASMLGCFPLFQPEVAGHEAVVLVDFAVAFFPVVKRPFAHGHPAENTMGRNLSFVFPLSHVIDDAVTHVVGNPDYV